MFFRKCNVEKKIVIVEKTSLSENAKLKKIKQNDLSPTFS
jgi:hypothetical protein